MKSKVYENFLFTIVGIACLAFAVFAVFKDVFSKNEKEKPAEKEKWVNVPLTINE